MAAKKTSAKIAKPRLNVRPPPPPASTDAPHDAKVAFVDADASGRGTGRPAAPKGGEKRRVNMLLPPLVVKRLRHLCADRDKDMTTATTEALEAYLSAAGY